jgi:flagellar FliL protein
MSTTATAPAVTGVPEEEQSSGGGRRKKLVVAAVLLLVLGGAGYWFLLKPSGPPPPPEPGEVLVLDAVQVNLEGGHYLRIGIALQLVADVADAPDGSKALDATIDLFSGREITELSKAKERHQLKEELMEHLEHEYHGDVMEVYFTEFVTQ